MRTSALPVGIVTFFFSDIEGSTRLVQQLDDDQWKSVIDRHFELTEQLVEGTSGLKVRTIGDAFFLVFEEANDAAGVALAVHRAHAAEPWPAGIELRVRIGLHTGLAALGGDDYVGLDVHLAARISSAANGGQTVVSRETARRVRDSLAEGARLDELGSHRLKDISEPHRLYQLTTPDLGTTFPAIRTEGRGELRIPIDPTEFVGREAEVREITTLLGGHRLVTLTGPGGSGKTRLSKRVAEAIVDDFGDGIYFGRCFRHRGPRARAGRRPHRARVHETQAMAPLDIAVRALQRQRTCLILDNLEQVIEAGADIATLIDRTDRLKVLATSRGPLHIRGEHEYPVPPLPVPEDGVAEIAASEAVQLFVARASEISPGFSLDGEDGKAVSEIVRRLYGLPLAIELAAARTRLLSPSDLLSRLGSSLEMLRSWRSDLPERQQTLRGAIQWSYDLLDGEAQWLLADLSVFAGGCRLVELIDVCSPGHPELLEGPLEDLLEQSLVRREGSRYRMLQTIREFGLERLAERGDEETIRDQHATAYQALAESAAPSLLTVGQAGDPQPARGRPRQLPRRARLGRRERQGGCGPLAGCGPVAVLADARPPRGGQAAPRTGQPTRGE